MIYTYVPAIIKYYLDQDPIIPNVPSWRCEDREQREHVLANLDKQAGNALLCHRHHRVIKSIFPNLLRQGATIRHMLGNATSC